LLLQAEQAAAFALRRLANDTAPPYVRGCLDELHNATLWVCEGLTKLMPPATRRPSPGAEVFADLTDQMMQGPAVVDRLRILNRHQRRVLLRIDALLREGLDSDLRAFLQGAYVVVGRNVSGCDDVIAELDREREVRRPKGEFTPGGSS
jgi:hypothetical protein